MGVLLELKACYNSDFLPIYSKAETREIPQFQRVGKPEVE